MKLRTSKVLLSIVLFMVVLLIIQNLPNKVAWAAAPYDDEFNTTSLNTRWSWLNEDSTRWSLSASPGNLRIVATRGDMFYAVCGNSQAKNVLLQQAPVGDFAIETKLSINPTVNYQQAGLLVFRDTNTYFKIGPAYEQYQWGGQGVQAVLVTGGGIEARFGFHLDTNGPIYLRLTKLSDRYLGYYSLDGQTWSLIGQAQSNAITDPKVGIFALTSCTGNPPDIPADFDYFRATNLSKGRTSIFTGQGFDRCEIPTLGQLQTWITNSPYKVVNLYIGGSRRSCANSALTSSYVTQLSQQGWKFIPTWVGSQCKYGDISNDLTTAYNQGVAEANAAINAATNLGLTLPNSSGIRTVVSRLNHSLQVGLLNCALLVICLGFMVHHVRPISQTSPKSVMYQMRSGLQELASIAPNIAQTLRYGAIVVWQIICGAIIREFINTQRDTKKHGERSV